MADTGTAKPDGKRRRWPWILGALVAFPLAGHGMVVGCTSMTPPAIEVAPTAITTAPDDPSRRELGRAWARKRGAITEIRLEGDPTTMGYAHMRLLYDDAVAIERDMHDQFAQFVPYQLARTLIVDLARLRFAGLDRRLTPGYRREIAAQALAFDPDPFTGLMDTYPRFVFLHSLYDIMLSFERSPLIGCTSFVVDGARTSNGHTLVGRNFDFEGPQILDDKKAVFLVLEQDRLPFASVSWPGFIGTTSGMNADGLAIVIHGARAGQTQSDGQPVAQTVRHLLATSHTTRQALAELEGHDPMVPHMLLIADSTGDAVAVERVPGRPAFARPISGGGLPLTNHLEGPSASDPKNVAVMASTSTVARRARLDELLATLPDRATPADVVAVLRDRRAPSGAELPLGHRDAIDALIATHSVVMDTTERVLWVSEGPHATGRFVRFDLQDLLDRDYRPSGPARVESLPSDDIRRDGRYDQWVKRGQSHPSGPPPQGAP
ncbi:MAG TPA: hypothetical protein ENK57_13210 [Polyangiaceae bacterium]|nr:hypothetical protein [Polyangiaceae bacterium]